MSEFLTTAPQHCSSQPKGGVSKTSPAFTKRCPADRQLAPRCAASESFQQQISADERGTCGVPAARHAGYYGEFVEISAHVRGSKTCHLSPNEGVITPLKDGGQSCLFDKSTADATRNSCIVTCK
jgi:hypothetical protein